MSNKTEIKEAAARIVAKLTLLEKAQLLSGRDHWHTEPVERLGVPSVQMTDGPCGVRRELPSDGILVNTSAPATCFPSAVGLGATFDTELIGEIGAAMAEEAKQQGVSALLGPGINIKRNPLCGRNFEYYSEDPVVSGECGAALIDGIQKNGVGACIKHYALNSQETMRLVSNSCADERTIRELYVSGFERAIKKSQPEMLMSSYNIVNNEYVGESEMFLERLLRCEWGFEGLVVSDWAAVCDRVRGVKAGLDLEMPGKCTGTTKDIMDAVESGTLKEWQVDACAQRVLEFVLKHGEAVERPDESVYKKNDALARKAAARCCVLLKNDGALPLDSAKRLGVVGLMAKKPRIQGTGSSRVNPAFSDNIVDELSALNIKFSYADGYTEQGDTNEELLREAAAVASGCDTLLLIIGLPDIYESEGYDRTHMRLPDGMLRLVSRMADENKNIVIGLQLGSPVELPFRDRVNAIVCAYLGGQASGGGFVDIITGRENPSARLAESFPERESDLPGAKYYATKSHFTEYREGIYIGYRYYDAMGVSVAYPFGHGLSYSSFKLRAIKLDSDKIAKGGAVEVSVKVENTSSRDGAEAVLLFAAKKGSPQKRLVAFTKARLAAGGEKTVKLTVTARDLSDFDVQNGRFTLLDGDVELIAKGSESALSATLRATGQKEPLAPYIEPTLNMNTPDELFYKLLGFVPQEPPEKPYTRNSTLQELSRTGIGKLIYGFAVKNAAGSDADPTTVEMMEKSLLEMPIRGAGSFSGGMLNRSRVDGIVAMANGRFFKGLGGIIRNK